MQQVVREITEGMFRTDSGSLDFSCPKVELTLRQGTTAEGSFSIYGPAGAVTEGIVLSSDMRVQCLTEQFFGSDEEISYRVDATGATAGTEIQGGFHIISNQGEYFLPFSMTIRAHTLASSLGEVKNLFHFTNLAKTNWQEAVALFYREDFRQLFDGSDRQYLAVWKALSAYPGNEHNVEEFLLQIRKKKPVELVPEEREIRIENPEAFSKYTLVINRNGWGYTHVDIETEGDFLQINEESLSDDAFAENLCRLNYFILDDRLHDGNNFGAIRLTCGADVLHIPVTVVCKSRKRAFEPSDVNKQKLLYELLQDYLAYRMKKTSASVWREETESLLSKLLQTDSEDISLRLFKIQLLLSEERGNEAKWQLDLEEDALDELREKEPALFCYALYLRTLCVGEDTFSEKACAEINDIYMERPEDWRIAWLLFYLSEEYARFPVRKWEKIGALFAEGCHSPIMYLEAWQLVAANPAMLYHLDEFELQVLWFACKNDLMQDDVMIQVLYLAQKQKDFSKSLYRLLCSCYDKTPRNDILQEICGLLIRGGCYGPAYLKWYQAGVEQNLRITRLYEYYMMSLPLDDRTKPPKMVLMYFSYQCDLQYEITAWLYAYVCRHEDEMPDIFLSYTPSIERFVIEQIQKGRMNRDLAYLYRRILKESMIDADLADKLLPLLFMWEVRPDKDFAGRVVVSYPYFSKQAGFPLSGGAALVPIYDDAACLLLEDEAHNRYVASISFQQEQLMTSNLLFSMVSPYILENPGYDVHACFQGKTGIEIKPGNIERFARLSEAPELDENCRQEIHFEMVRFYYENDRLRELDTYLETLDPEELLRPNLPENLLEEGRKIVATLAARGLYEEAWHWIFVLGPYGLSTKTMVRVCSRYLTENGMEEDPVMTGVLCYVLQKGKYDETTLQYLVRYFNGSTKEMRDIWKTACDFGVDAYAIGERILVQMLYTGAYVGEKSEIFRNYLQSGGREELINAYVSQCCYDYVVREKITDVILIQCVLRLLRAGEPLHVVCKLAYLKYYAENKDEIDADIREAICTFLKELIDRNLVLPFFQAFEGYIPAMEQIMDKTILEYRAAQGRRVAIHYLLQREDADNAQYCTEDMREVFAGIWVKEFVLFFGERLQYYITEEADGVEQLTVSGTLGRKENSDGTTQGGRFRLLNDIMIGKTLQDYDTVDQLLEEYYRKDFLVEKLFTPR